MKKTIVVAIAATAIVALATPSFAQTARPAQGLSDKSAPAYVVSTPEKCWVEDGNSRWSTCDGGN
jgi:hypothetical protein